MMILSFSILVPSQIFIRNWCVCVRVCVERVERLETLLVVLATLHNIVYFMTTQCARRCMVIANCCKNINYRDNRQ